MSDMYFKGLPDKSTPLIPSNLDKLNDIKVSPTEPTTNEKVWIDNSTGKIYVKNDDGEYQEFLNAETMGIETITNENGTAIKFPDGTMICSGKAEIPANTNWVQTNFPVAFIDTDYIMTASNTYISGGGSIQLQNITTVQENAQDNIYIYSILPDGSTPTYKRMVSYRAIGRWK